MRRCERTLKELHNIILRNINSANAGVYRKSNVIISGASHIPPPSTQVQEKMDAFFAWYISVKLTLHPVELVTCPI